MTKPLKVGALFAGYGGLELGLSMVLHTELAWVAELDEYPSQILKHHWPDVPNHGDVTKIDWTTVDPVDIIAGGSPCQDVSHAGRRAGMRVGTRSGLWASMVDAVDIIRPRLVVWENVRGAFSAGADSDMGWCERCVAYHGGDSVPALRALGRVLGDLSDLGYDAWWYGLRAADVGLCHGRFRVFVFAVPATDPRGWPRRARSGERQQPGPASGTGPSSVPRGRGLLPANTDESGLEGRGRLHPAPRQGQTRPRRGASAGVGHHPGQWGVYAAAIRRHELAIGSPAPPPTERDLRIWEKRRQVRIHSTKPIGMRGSIWFIVKGPTARLSPRFVEWMMGLPAGWVTGVGLGRNAELKILGNGVVPQQAAAACARFLRDSENMT